MLIIPSFGTLICILIQIAVLYFGFKITDRQSLYTVACGTAIADILLYIVRRILGTNLILNLVYHIFVGIGLNFLYKKYGYGDLNKKSELFSVINTIIMYFA